MNIVIDLDHTLFDNNVCDITCKEMGVPYIPNNYDLSDLREDVRNKCFDRFKDPIYMGNLEPIHGCYDVLNLWKNIGHKLYCVTLRHNDLIDCTQKMISEHYPMIDETFVYQNSNYNKNEMLLKLEADVFIDDNQYVIKNSLECNLKKCFMISNDTTPYNFGYKFDGVIIVKDIYEIEQIGGLNGI